MTDGISGARRLLYGLGSAGWQISDRIVVSIAVYFYLPPPGRGLESQVSPRVYPEREILADMQPRPSGS